jgi:hypothetical protein
MPTRQFFLFFILLFLALPTLRAAVPLPPVATTVSISQSPPIEPIIKKTKKPRKPKATQIDADFLGSWAILAGAICIASGLMISLGLLGIVASIWVLLGGLGHLAAGLLMLTVIAFADEKLAGLVYVILTPVAILLLAGLSFLIGGLLSSTLWAILTGVGFFLLLIILLGIYIYIFNNM